MSARMRSAAWAAFAVVAAAIPSWAGDAGRPSQRHIYFTAELKQEAGDRGEHWILCRVPEHDGTVEALTTGPQDVGAALSWDASRIVFSRWTHDGRPGTLFELPMSPKADRVVREMAEFRERLFECSLSPDGKRLLYADERLMLHVRNLTDGKDAVPFDSPGQQAVWSPDGTRILFTAGPDLRVLELASGRHVRVGAGVNPRFHPSGKRVSCLHSPWDGAISVSNIADGKTEELRLSSEGSLVSHFWSPDGNRLAVVENANGETRLVIHDLGGKPATVRLKSGDSAGSHRIVRIVNVFGWQ